MWIVGFFEGEGSTGCYDIKVKKWRWKILTTCIAQKELYILKWIRKVLGFGYINRQNNIGFNKTYIYKWQVSSPGSIVFLGLILPHLKSHKKIYQVNKALKQYYRFYKNKIPCYQK